MNYKQQIAQDFARRISGLGFRVFLANDGVGVWGFITDADGSRVLGFSTNDGGSLSGNYGPPSSESGTGWKMDGDPSDLRTADDVKRHLYAHPPAWAGKGWNHLTNLKEYLALYPASRFAEFSADV